MPCIRIVHGLSMSHGMILNTLLNVATILKTRALLRSKNNAEKPEQCFARKTVVTHERCLYTWPKLFLSQLTFFVCLQEWMRLLKIYSTILIILFLFYFRFQNRFIRVADLQTGVQYLKFKRREFEQNQFNSTIICRIIPHHYLLSMSVRLFQKSSFNFLQFNCTW